MLNLILKLTLSISSASTVTPCSSEYLAVHEDGIRAVFQKWTSQDSELNQTLENFLAAKPGQEPDGVIGDFTYRFSCWNNQYLDAVVETEMELCEYSVSEELAESEKISQGCISAPVY